MKPFDLEKALAGEPVVTRDGREVFGIVRLKNPGGIYKIGGWVCSASTDGSRDVSITWKSNGSYRDSFHDLDIFMAPRKRTVWVNVYTNGERFFAGQCAFYNTMAAAEATRKYGPSGQAYLGTFPLEIEE